MRTKFASVMQPNKYGYAYDSDAWTSQAEVDTHFRMFETYGDGLCQHSGDWAITLDFMTDYLASLATAMLTDEELVNKLSWEFQRRPSDDTIEFCASVVCKESDREWGKRRWYSVSEKKVSSSRSKEYDKRYEEVREWNDGTPKAIYRMLLPDYADGLQRYAYTNALHDWAMRHRDVYMELPAEFLEWFKGPEQRDKARALRHAFDACVAICKAHQLRSGAMNDLAEFKPKAVEVESDAA